MDERVQILKIGRAVTLSAPDHEDLAHALRILANNVEQDGLRYFNEIHLAVIKKPEEQFHVQ